MGVSWQGGGDEGVDGRKFELGLLLQMLLWRVLGKGLDTREGEWIWDGRGHFYREDRTILSVKICRIGATRSIADEWASGWDAGGGPCARRVLGWAAEGTKGSSRQNAADGGQRRGNRGADETRSHFHPNSPPISRHANATTPARPPVHDAYSPPNAPIGAPAQPGGIPIGPGAASAPAVQHPHQEYQHPHHTTSDPNSPVVGQKRPRSAMYSPTMPPPRSMSSMSNSATSANPANPPNNALIQQHQHQHPHSASSRSPDHSRLLLNGNGPNPPTGGIVNVSVPMSGPRPTPANYASGANSSHSSSSHYHNQTYGHHHPHHHYNNPSLAYSQSSPSPHYHHHQHPDSSNSRAAPPPHLVNTYPPQHPRQHHGNHAPNPDISSGPSDRQTSLPPQVIHSHSHPVGYHDEYHSASTGASSGGSGSAPGQQLPRWGSFLDDLAILSEEIPPDSRLLLDAQNAVDAGKQIPLIIEYCRVLLDFANRYGYASHSSHSSSYDAVSRTHNATGSPPELIRMRPPDAEMQEMTQRALLVVFLIRNLAKQQQQQPLPPPPPPPPPSSSQSHPHHQRQNQNHQNHQNQNRHHSSSTSSAPPPSHSSSSYTKNTTRAVSSSAGSMMSDNGADHPNVTNAGSSSHNGREGGMVAGSSSNNGGTRTPSRPWEENNNDQTMDGGGSSTGSRDRSESAPIDEDNKNQLDKMYGGDKEAQERAVQDMDTIKTKRSASGAGPATKTRYKKRSRATPPGRCHSCNIRETPEWRRGPDGARTLCNACGLHFAKLSRKREKTIGPDGNPPPPIDIEMLRASARLASGFGASDPFIPKTSTTATPAPLPRSPPPPTDPPIQQQPSLPTPPAPPPHHLPQQLQQQQHQQQQQQHPHLSQGQPMVPPPHHHHQSVTGPATYWSNAHRPPPPPTSVEFVPQDPFPSSSLRTSNTRTSP